LARTVLVVEDDAGFRFALTGALQHLGFRVLATGSPDGAYDLLDRESIDAILLDVRLPIASGLSLYRAMLRRWPGLAGRVALMTGDPDSDAVRAWRGHTAGAVFAKPFQPEEVAAWVIEATGDKSLVNPS
jgi:DNA-binding response OmpR family regulator